MNFLIITFDFPPTVGGIEMRIKNYIRNLVRVRCGVEVVALTSTSNSIFSENYLGATLYRCPSSSRFIFKTFLSLVNAMRHHSIEVIHVLTGANTLIGLLFLLHGKVVKLKTGVFLYGKDILSSKNNPLQFLLLHFALILADKIGVNSKATSQLLPRRVTRKIHVLYPGVDVQIVRRYKIPRIVGEKKKRILFVGRLIKRKGVDDLLRAFKSVKEEIPNARLLIVGDGPERNELHNLAKTLGIRDKVEFTGTLVGKELYTKYQECDVFVMPSKKIGGDVEGFGMVFLEAGLFKKPSIGTWSGGIPEAIVNGQTGILVPEGDVSALKSAIVTLLTNKKLAERLGRNAHRRVVNEFTWKRATLRLIEMYQ